MTKEKLLYRNQLGIPDTTQLKKEFSPTGWHKLNFLGYLHDMK